MALATSKHNGAGEEQAKKNPDTKSDRLCNRRKPSTRKQRKLRCMFCDFWTFEDKRDIMVKHSNFYHSWK